METEYITLLTIFVSLISGWGGAFINGYLTRKASTDILDKEYKLEVKKDRDKQKNELLNLYVDIIKLDNEARPVNHDENHNPNLNLTFFKNKIRPRIYDKYYLIHEDVIYYFNRMEILFSNIENDIYVENIEIDFVIYYDLFLLEIKFIVDEQRIKTD